MKPLLQPKQHSLAVMAHVTLGPFLVNNGLSGLVAPSLEHSGYSMEISSDEFSKNICIYRQINDWQSNAIRLEDFYVSFDEIPFNLLPVAQTKQHTSMVGVVVSLEAVLCSLYIKHEVTKSITSALEELRQHLPINHCYYPRRDDGAKLILPVLAEAGFEVIRFFPYGRTLSVMFGWVYPQDRQNAKAKLNAYAGTIEFKPQPNRTLGQGHWQIPKETSMSYLLTQIMETLSGEGVLSEAGIETAVNNFKWTKVSTLTAQEAKLARVEFVRTHPELHGNHQALARALKDTELYSDTAEVYAIKKQVPRLIREAGEVKEANCSDDLPNVSE